MGGRIPDHFIDDLVARTDIVELISSRIKMKRSGKNYMACCPFHNEKTPSFTVSPHKQFYYCFGCGANGNAINFIKEYDRLSFVDAVEQLAKSLGVEVPREGSNQQQENLQPLYQVLETANQYYQTQLKNPQVRQVAIAYLKARGISGESAKRFQIGFAPPGWDNLIKHIDTAKTELLIRAGLAVKNDRGRIYDRFRDRIMFPIRDPRGRTIGFGGRVLGNDKPKYLNSPETPVFHKSRELYGLYEARHSSQKITRHLIVEGYMDVVSLAQAGIDFSVATLGTASNQEHLEKLFKQVNDITFCFDGDTAGRNAARRALENAIPTMKDGRQIRFLFLPEGEDPDSMVQQQGPEVFLDLIDKAQPLSDYFFSSLSHDLDIKTLDGKARLASLAAPHIQRIPKGVFRDLMLQKLANLTELTSNAIEAHLQQKAQPLSNDTAATQPTAHEQHQQPRTQPSRQHPNNRANTTKTAMSPLVDAIIRMTLHTPKEAAQHQLPEGINNLQAPFGELLEEMFEVIKNRPDISTASLLGRWHDKADGEHLASLAAKEFLLDEASQTVELQDGLKRLKNAIIDAQLAQLIAEGAADKEKLKALLDLKD